MELLQKRVLDNIAMIKQKYIAMFKKDLMGKDNKELTERGKGNTKNQSFSHLYNILFEYKTHRE